MTHAWEKALLGRRCGTWKEILSVGEGWTSLPNSERAKRTRFLFCIFCMHGMCGIYVCVYIYTRYIYLGIYIYQVYTRYIYLSIGI